MRNGNRTIDCLRAGAALLVVLGHLRELLFVDFSASSHSPLSQAFYVLTGLGRQAVYVFFALSGFWVGGWVLRHVQRHDFSWSAHLLRRLTRLWTVLVPVLLIVLAVDTIGRHYLGGTAYYRGTDAFHDVAPTGAESHLGLATAVGNVAFLQGYWVRPFGTDGALWSLGYEFWYYLLFPLVALAWVARRLRVRTALAGLVLAAGVAAGPEAVQLFPAWLLGLAAYAVVASGRARRISASRHLGALQSSAAALTLLVCVAMEATHAAAPVAALADALVAGVFLVLASREVDPPRPVRPVLRLGGGIASFSYTLYAVHQPLLLLACAVLSRDGVKHTLTPGWLALYATLLVCVVAAASLVGAVTERQTDRVRAAVERAARGGLGRTGPRSRPEVRLAGGDQP